MEVGGAGAERVGVSRGALPRCGAGLTDEGPVSRDLRCH